MKPLSMLEVPVKKLLLAGAGHAHIGLLRGLSTERPENVDITLVTDTLQSVYSGMLPGWMAGHYHLDDITIDVTPLCEQAGVRFVQSPIAKVDAASCTVTTTNDEILNYDVLSLNTGADTDMRWLNAADASKTTAQKVPQTSTSTLSATISADTDTDTDTDTDASIVVTIRPLSTFIDYWQQILTDAQKSNHYRLAVVGAGAAATELVMAAQIALQRINPKHQAYLVCGEHLLSGFIPKFRQRVIGQFKRHSIIVVPARAISYSNGQLFTTKDSLAVDAVIAATGVSGAVWTQHTDLETVDNGFVAVNATQQSISHPNVFAVGDVATRVDQSVVHSGVHAVYGGVVMADNLLSYLAGKPKREYRPRTRTLYLLSCGDKYAIASWGNISLQGRWIWYLKRYIDQGFVKSNQD